MSVANAGMKMLKIQKDTPISVAGIRASARNLLKRQISRGRAMSLMTPSPYWLRPGDTVTAQLPTGPQERHLVASTAFRFPSGECSIRTRLPANVEITGE
jgi:hypothetical protein